MDFLLATGSLRFGDFKLVSGRNSPYYVNLRGISNGSHLLAIGNFYADRIKSVIDINSFDVLFGLTYAGIPIATATAISLWMKYNHLKRFAFGRKEPKEHGDPKDRLLGGGDLKEGDVLLLIDDVLTTGETKIKWKEFLVNLNLHLDFRGILVMFDRCESDSNGLPAKSALEKQGLKVYSVLDARSVIQTVRDRNIVSEEMGSRLRSYLSEYGACESEATR